MTNWHHLTGRQSGPEPIALGQKMTRAEVLAEELKDASPAYPDLGPNIFSGSITWVPYESLEAARDARTAHEQYCAEWEAEYQRRQRGFADWAKSMANRGTIPSDPPSLSPEHLRSQETPAVEMAPKTGARDGAVRHGKPVTYLGMTVVVDPTVPKDSVRLECKSDTARVDPVFYRKIIASGDKATPDRSGA